MNYRKLQLRCEEMYNELDALLAEIGNDVDEDAEDTGASDVLDAVQDAMTALESAGTAAEEVADAEEC